MTKPVSICRPDAEGRKLVSKLSADCNVRALAMGAEVGIGPLESALPFKILALTLFFFACSL